MYVIYWLINETQTRTYLGFSDDLKKRLRYHKNKKVKSTRNFGKFKCYIIEKVDSLSETRKREKYWKSAAGRKKLKTLFSKITKK